MKRADQLNLAGAGVRFVGRHAKTCDWLTVYLAAEPERTVKLDFLGRAHAHYLDAHTWLRFQCPNHPDCQASMLVRADAIPALVRAAHGERTLHTNGAVYG